MGSNLNYCLYFVKQVTLIWREGQLNLEKAFYLPNQGGNLHTNNRTEFFANMGEEQMQVNYNNAFSIYQSHSKVIAMCLRRHTG